MSEVRARYSAYELRELELAESVCPWGEMAETLRAVYLADRVAALLGDKDGGREAERVLNRLLGPAPPARRKDLASQVRGRKL